MAPFSEQGSQDRQILLHLCIAYTQHIIYNERCSAQAGTGCDTMKAQCGSSSNRMITSPESDQSQEVSPAYAVCNNELWAINQ